MKHLQEVTQKYQQWLYTSPQNPIYSTYVGPYQIIGACVFLFLAKGSLPFVVDIQSAGTLYQRLSQACGYVKSSQKLWSRLGKDCGFG